MGLRSEAQGRSVLLARCWTVLSDGDACLLQHAVVKIVREKYLKTTSFESQEELQKFISELYVFLVDQMHVALNQVGALELSTLPFLCKSSGSPLNNSFLLASFLP